MRVTEGAGRAAGAAAVVLTSGSMAGLVRAGALRRSASYLSLLGASGEPTQFRFQVAVWMSAGALACAALAVALLLRPRPGRARWLPWAAQALSTSALCYALVAEVPCTQGCPLPPYSDTLSPQDFAHAAIAVAAYVSGVGAMLLVWACAPDRFLRWASGAAAALVGATVAAGALAALAQVQGAAGGELERLATAVGAAWLAALGCRLAFQRRRVRRAPRVVTVRAERQPVRTP